MTTQDERHEIGSHGVLARFRRDRSGNTAILFAMMTVVLMLAIGAAVDIGRWLHARDQTMAAIDAALLAGGRYLQTESKDTSGALALARKFYTENVRSRIPVTNDTVDFTVADNGMAITASGNAYIKTPFLQLASIDKLPLIDTATAEFSKAEIAVGGNGGESLEIAVMLDVTGSMAGQKLRDLKDAAKDLIDVVVWKDQSEYTSKVALVPFSEDVRLPTTAALDKARGTGLDQTETKSNGWLGSTTYYLSDCVVERTGSQKYTDAAPKRGQYVMAHYTQNYTQSGGGGGGYGFGGFGGFGGGGGGTKTGVCAVPSGSEVQPLTNDRDTLLDKIEKLSASGGTAGQIGTAWAWYTLSPNWNPLWSGQNQAAAYGTDKLQKIAILMTDGEYNTQYDSSGISASESQAANGSSTSQARALCAAMKQKGITVYTVGFDLGGNRTAMETLNQCATDPTKYYNADDGEQLKQAFRDIALKLSSLYLSK
jgi:uncharacterized protein YegL